jgi:Xaa-Pro aminopeptidase
MLIAVVPVWGQYTDLAELQAHGGPQEFARRQKELAQRVQKGYVLLFARTQTPESAHYREDNDFFYFTGMADPGAVLLIDTRTGEMTLFEPEQSESMRRTYGANVLSLPAAERAKVTLAAVRSTSTLESTLSMLALEGDPDLWVRIMPDMADRARMEMVIANTQISHPFQPEVEQVAVVRKLIERFPTARFHNVAPIVDAMRNIKTPAEIDILRRNGRLSAAGIRRALAQARPGMYEYEIENEATHVFRAGGAQGVAYTAIVASGPNVNTWHYFSDRRRTEPNDLVVFDFAADLYHEAMDITRTFNVSGKFTPEQAKWYAVDLAAQEAIIAMLRPGNTYDDATAAGKAVYARAGIGDKLRRFPGHFVGLSTHDALVSGPIRAGQVVAVEPIIEFIDEHLHFRIEDTVLVTENGPEVLTADVPKEMTEVEKLVGSEGRTAAGGKKQ